MFTELPSLTANLPHSALYGEWTQNDLQAAERPSGQSEILRFEDISATGRVSLTDRHLLSRCPNDACSSASVLARAVVCFIRDPLLCAAYTLVRTTFSRLLRDRMERQSLNWWHDQAAIASAFLPSEDRPERAARRGMFPIFPLDLSQALTLPPPPPLS